MNFKGIENFTNIKFNDLKQDKSKTKLDKKSNHIKSSTNTKNASVSNISNLSDTIPKQKETEYKELAKSQTPDLKYSNCECEKYIVSNFCRDCNCLVCNICLKVIIFNLGKSPKSF